MSTAPRLRSIGRLPLWFGLLGGPLAWALQLVVNYYLVSISCALELRDFMILEIPGFALLMVLVTLLTLAVTLAAGAVAWWTWRRTGVGSQTDLSAADGRTHFLALGGLLLNGLFAVAILLAGLSNLFLSPCL